MVLLVTLKQEMHQHQREPTNRDPQNTPKQANGFAQQKENQNHYQALKIKEIHNTIDQKVQ